MPTRRRSKIKTIPSPKLYCFKSTLSPNIGLRILGLSILSPGYGLGILYAIVCFGLSIVLIF